MTVHDHSQNSGMRIYRPWFGPPAAEPRGSGQYEFPVRGCNGTVPGCELGVQEENPARASELKGGRCATYQRIPQ